MNKLQFKFIAIKRLFKIKYNNIKRRIILSFLLFKRRQKQNWRYKRRKLIIRYSIIFLIILLSTITITNKRRVIDNSTHTKEVLFVDTTNTLESFLKQLRWMESADDYYARRQAHVVIVTSHGNDTVKGYSQYIGYYQLGNAARKVASDVCPSLKSISVKQYWESEFYQHKSAICWFIYLRKIMDPEINKFNGKFFGTFYVTESGILAMSHLVGPYATKSWLNSKFDMKKTYNIVDGNGKKGTDYLQQLGRYDLRLTSFIDENGDIKEDKIDEFVNNIIKNKSSKDMMIKEIEDKYIIIDSIR